MSKLPVIQAKKLVKVVRKNGFVFKRQQRSHAFFEHKMEEQQLFLCMLAKILIVDF